MTLKALYFDPQITPEIGVSICSSWYILFFTVIKHVFEKCFPEWDVVLGSSGRSLSLGSQPNFSTDLKVGLNGQL